MNAIRNAKIKTKILGAFVSALILATILNMIGIQRISLVDTTYSSLIIKQTDAMLLVSNTKASLDLLRINLREYWVYSQDVNRVNQINSSLNALYNSFISDIDKIRNIEGVDADAAANRILAAMAQYYTAAGKINTAIVNGDFTEATRILEQEATPNYNTAVAEFDEFYKLVINYADTTSLAITAETDILVLAMTILLIVLFCCVVVTGNTMIAME